MTQNLPEKERQFQDSQLVKFDKQDTEIAEKLNMDIDIYRSLRYSLFPDAKIPEIAFGMYMAICKAKRYDPLKKAFHIVMMPRNVAEKGKEDVWESYPSIMPGIVSYRIDAARTGSFHGISDAEFGPMITEKFTSLDSYSKKTIEKTVIYPEWCRLVIFKKIGDMIIEIPAKLYWKECYVPAKKNSLIPNDMWCKRPRAQLEKCCEALAYRKGWAEEIGGILTHEEMQGRHTHEDDEHLEKDITPEKPQLETDTVPLSQTVPVDETELLMHIDKIKNCVDMGMLKIVYMDAVKFCKGNKEASNQIADLKEERKKYIEQLTKKDPTPEEAKKTADNVEEFFNEYDGKKGDKK
jgi:phage recombination protein Bet